MYLALPPTLHFQEYGSGHVLPHAHGKALDPLLRALLTSWRYRTYLYSIPHANIQPHYVRKYDIAAVMWTKLSPNHS